MSTLWGCDTTAQDTPQPQGLRNVDRRSGPQGLRNLPHSNAVHNPCPKREPLPFAFKLACLAVGSFLVGWLGFRLYGYWILWKH